MENFIFDSVISQEDRLVHLEKLNTLKDSVFKTGDEFKKTLNELFSEKEAQKLNDFFERSKAAGDPTRLADGIEAIKKSVKNFEVIELHFSYQPEKNFLLSIASWFYQNKVNPVFEIIVDRKLVGGVLIGFRGKYFDFSLNKLIDQKYGQI